MLEVTTVVTIPGLKKFAKRLRSDPALSLRVTKVWAARYRGFVQQRFRVYSSGGGDWKPLAESTKAARRKGRGQTGGKQLILRNNGQLFNALNPSTPNADGALARHGPFKVDVGYGGPARHAGGGSASIADIAKWHNDGAGHLPQRKIIVPPEVEVRAKMAEDCEKIIKKQSKDDIDGSSS